MALTTTPQDWAASHAAAFPGKGWDAETFQTYIADPAVTLHGDPSSFAVARQIGDEVEILTLATHPDARRTGQATRMLSLALAHHKAKGAAAVFLEVATDNAPARALYAKSGFEPIAERKDYYRAPSGARVSALILRKQL